MYRFVKMDKVTALPRQPRHRTSSGLIAKKPYMIYRELSHIVATAK